MKTKFFMTVAFSVMAMSSFAQVQLLYTDCSGRHVIERNKKLYWMEAGDEDPCFEIQNYKKVGNQETFSLKSKELNEYGKTDIYNVVMQLDAKTQEPIEITLSSSAHGKQSGKVRTTSGSKNEDERLKEYFNGLAGNPAQPEQVVSNAAPSVSEPASDDQPEAEPQSAADKVKNAAKSTLGNVKGVFKKKK